MSVKKNMGNWSALSAMKAYLSTLELCKTLKNQGSEESSKRIVEPECIEYISAVAAGNQAKLMVNVTSKEEGPSPSTLALAIAATYTSGRLICVCDDQTAATRMRSQLEGFGLGDVADFKVGELSEVIEEFKNIDFAVVDSRIDDCEQVLLGMDMNPNGSVVVLSDLFHRKNEKKKASASYVKLKRGKVSREEDGGVLEFGVLPIGNGMEVTKIGMGCTKQTKKSSK